MIKRDKSNISVPFILEANSEPAKREFKAAKEHYTPVRNNGSFSFNIYKHDSIKHSLSDLFHGKCAYCESNYEGNQPVDIEHYRPKSEILLENGDRLIGYWWLAADWENLLPSCIDCNRERKQYLLDGGFSLLAGKGSKFPILDPRTRASKPGEERNEIPLLLNPCEHDPFSHLSFEERRGLSIAVNVGRDAISSERSATSIQVLGLNRKGLVNRRTAHIKHVKLTLSSLEAFLSLLDNPGSDHAVDVATKELTKILRHLNELQQSHSEFSAASRALIQPILERLDHKVQQYHQRLLLEEQRK